MNKTLLLSTLAASALFAGCRTTQYSHARRGLLDADSDSPVRQSAQSRVRAPSRPAAPAAAPVAAASVAERPLAPEPQPAAAPVQSVAAPAQPAAAPARPAVAAPAATPVKAAAAPTFETYVVQPGDIAGRIANRHGMTLKEFCELNDLSLEQAGKLRVKQTVKVWAGQEPLKPGPAIRAPEAPAADDPNVHVVRPGDTLSGISAKTGVPVATLMADNNIDNPNAIRVGQKLTLRASGAKAQPAKTQAAKAQPVAAQPAKTQAAKAQPVKTQGAKPQPTAAAQLQQDASVPLDQVKVADTDSSLEDLLAGLSLSEARRQADETAADAERHVQEAAKAAKSAADGAAADAKAAPPGYRYYSAVEGDNLYKLTARFKVPIQVLRDLNGLPKTASKLEPGTVLLVPDAAAAAR